MDKKAKQYYRIAAAVVLAAAVSFGAGAPQAKNTEQVRLVSNPLLPKDGVVTPKITELWSVGGENDPQGELLNRPFEIRVDKNGFVFVLDWGDTCIRVFDASGKFVRQIGRKGQGPGDFDIPCWFDLDAEGRVHVLDGRSLRITRFDRDGKYLASFRIEKFASQIRLDSSGRIFCAETSRGESELSTEFRKIQQTISIVRYDPDGKNPVRIGPFKADVIVMKTDAKGGVFSGSSPSAPTTGWSVAPDGRIWAGYNGTYEIGVFDPDGKPLFRFGREFKPLHNKGFDKITPENRKTTILPEDFPAFAQDFFFDDAGNAWFRMFKNEEDKNFRFDVFSPEGVYLKQIVVPFRIYRVLGDRMIGLVDSEEGFKVLKCYRFQ